MSRSAPQGLKPISFASLSGTAEAVTFPKPLMRLLLKLLMLMAPVSSMLAHPAFASNKDKNRIPAVRWAEGNPGCTFSRDADGKSRHGLWSDDPGTVMALPPQDLTK